MDEYLAGSNPARIPVPEVMVFSYNFITEDVPGSAIHRLFYVLTLLPVAMIAYLRCRTGTWQRAILLPLGFLRSWIAQTLMDAASSLKPFCLCLAVWIGNTNRGGITQILLWFCLPGILILAPEVPGRIHACLSYPQRMLISAWWWKSSPEAIYTGLNFFPNKGASFKNAVCGVCGRWRSKLPSAWRGNARRKDSPAGCGCQFTNSIPCREVEIPAQVEGSTPAGGSDCHHPHTMRRQAGRRPGCPGRQEHHLTIPEGTEPIVSLRQTHGCGIKRAGLRLVTEIKPANQGPVSPGTRQVHPDKVGNKTIRPIQQSRTNPNGGEELLHQPHPIRRQGSHIIGNKRHTAAQGDGTGKRLKFGFRQALSGEPSGGRGR